MMAEECLQKHTYYIANSFQYDSNGLVTDYNRPNVFTLNKVKVVYEDFYAEQSAANNILLSYPKKNVLLLGDMIEDAEVARDSEHETIIRVGYLNKEPVTESLEREFKDTYDLVIYGDGTLNSVNQLLRLMAG